MFELFGIPVEFSIWHVAMMLLFWVDGFVYVRKVYPKSNKNGYALAGFICLVIVFVGLVLHEAAHAVVSELLGIKIVGAGLTAFGAYVRPEASPFDIPPMHELLIVIAGPLTNLLMAGMFVIPVKLMGESLAENTFQYGAYINWRIGLLNLIPIIFFDGGKAAHAIFRMFGMNSDVALVATLITGILFLIWWFFLRKKFKKTSPRPGFEEIIEKL